MIAAAPPASASENARSDDTVIHPRGSSEASAIAPVAEEGQGGFWMLTGVFLLAVAGAWLLLRHKGLPLSRVVRTGRLLTIEESKSLGNRQYLVVAGCEGRRFLLGVTPGRIQLLSPLDDAEGDVDA